jgi:Pyruvate/2-oxoacid:ferredoxin oxidoreductase delta subunit
VLVTHKGDDPKRPVRCAQCWRKTPEDVIIREQEAYEKHKKETYA